MGVQEGFRYQGPQLTHVAFPLGGLGVGMLCLEGNGGLNHVSIRNRPELYNEPGIFASVHFHEAGEGASAGPGNTGTARILQGPVQAWKIYGPGSDRGNGISGRAYGYPRFASAEFTAKFPFATVRLADKALPIEVACTGWSPFVPGDADRSGMPVAALEYSLTNTGTRQLKAVFGFHVPSFLSAPDAPASIASAPAGFVIAGREGQLAVRCRDGEVRVDHCWFRGGWWDPATTLWDTIASGTIRESPPVSQPAAPGASLWVPVTLSAGATSRLRILLAWYFPTSTLVVGDPTREGNQQTCDCSRDETHRPYYASQYSGASEVMRAWTDEYDSLRQESLRFSDCLFAMEAPAEIVDAVSANLSILKSPTVLRDTNGRAWGWEGCFDAAGCCHGTCTHVWNYAQAMAHLFPALERGLRETEFHCSQDPTGHQNFRTSLPIAYSSKRQIAASDGQLGGIVKVYREWRISGDQAWLRRIWPAVKRSMDFCIRHWDPRERGVLTEAHHNTYDIEFWGPEPMCSSIYLGALTAYGEMATALGEDAARYRRIAGRGRRYLERKLFNGEYFFQEVEYKELKTPYTVEEGAPPEALERARREGPKYQYGTGCLSDGVIGAWLGEASGLPPFLAPPKVRRHLKSVFRYNFRLRLLEHGNPQRAGYAMHDEGGLLLCSWPQGGQPSLPMVYSHEVWTGIEYQVASHLLMNGLSRQALAIVRAVRSRYDGARRNPFDEYECGHWYARALASYALLQAASGARYDAAEKTLFIAPNLKGDVLTFLCTATGYGLAGVRGGRPVLEVRHGRIDVNKVVFKGEEVEASGVVIDATSAEPGR